MKQKMNFIKKIKEKYNNLSTKAKKGIAYVGIGFLGLFVTSGIYTIGHNRGIQETFDYASENSYNTGWIEGYTEGYIKSTFDPGVIKEVKEPTHSDNKKSLKEFLDEMKEEK